MKNVKKKLLNLIFNQSSQIISIVKLRFFNILFKKYKFFIIKAFNISLNDFK